MAKYRQTEAGNGQGLFLAVNLKEQLIPGSFEYMLDHIVDTKIDTSIFDKNYKNDHTGASAVPPAILFKLITYGYRNGQLSSRKLEALNEYNIIAKALTGDMSIHWTTIADFISKNSSEFIELFVQVLAYCNELGLIGGENYAIDGLRLPSNASIEKSGTKEQLEKRLSVYRRMAEKHVTRHRQKDERGENDVAIQKRYEKRQRHLKRQIEKIGNFLQGMEPKKGAKGQELQSNVTDNESAMIISKSGFIQGYIGLAVSDQKSQIIVSASAVGSAHEGVHLSDMLDTQAQNLSKAGVAALETGKQPVLLGDPNYFSEENLEMCARRDIDAVIPDGLDKRRKNAAGEQRYESVDFIYHEEGNYYTCPQGKRLTYKGTVKFKDAQKKEYCACVADCRLCPCFSQCIVTKTEQSKISLGKKLLVGKRNEPGSFSHQMRVKLGTEEYQAKYAYRIQIVEPVFANISYCKGLDRFTLRGKEKVNGQWQLYCIVHNLGKCLNGFNTGVQYA